MAQTPPAKSPTGPKVSGTRTIVSLVFLVVVLVVCGIELRAGLGQFLTLRSFNKISENNLFKNLSLIDAQGMVAAFPSKSDVQVGEYEDVHHYYWYSLLRPLMGEKNPELFVSADHSSPPKAVSFYTSTEGEAAIIPKDPNAPPSSTMPPGGPMGMSMSPPGGVMPGGGMMGGGPPGSGGKGGNADRPPLEDAGTDPETIDPAPADPAATDAPKTEGEPGATPTEAAPTEATPSDADSTTEPAKEDEKPETPAAPN